jgi:hypothetical protein
MRHNIYTTFSLRVYIVQFNKPLNCSTNTSGKVSRIMRHFIVVALRYYSPSVMFTFVVSFLRYKN